MTPFDVRFSIRLLCVFVLSSSLVGCWGPVKGKNELETVAVKGTVKVNGKPTGPASLQLRSADKSFPSVAGSVAPDGKFILMTYRLNDGAPKGKFTATLAAGDPRLSVPKVEPLEVEISKADSNLVLEFKGEEKETPHPLSIQPKMKKSSSMPGMPKMPGTP